MQHLRRLKVSELVVAGFVAVFILGLPLLAWKRGMEGSAFLYRNGFVAGLWRFAVVGLVAWGIKTLLTRRLGKVLALLSIVLFIFLGFIIFLLLLTPVGFLPLFAFSPTVQYNALGFLIPFILALGLVLSPHQIICCAPRHRSRLAFRFLIISVLASAFLVCISLIALAMTPNNHKWFAEYLAKKYPVSPYSLAELKALPAPNPPPPPLGLVTRYLIYGERAVDYSALDD